MRATVSDPALVNNRRFGITMAGTLAAQQSQQKRAVKVGGATSASIVGKRLFLSRKSCRNDEKIVVISRLCRCHF